MEDQFKQFNEYGEKHSTAYKVFSDTHDVEHPPPVQSEVSKTDWYIPVALMALVIASVIVSGSRTIFEFGGGFIGIAAFVMLELAIVALSFYRTRIDSSPDRMTNVKKKTTYGLYLAFTVAVAANVHATLKQDGVFISSLVNTGILLLVAISAPTLAFITGDIMAIEYLRSNRAEAEADKQHETNMQAWREAKHRAWQRRQKEWGIRIESEPVKVVNPVQLTDKQPQQRASKQLDRAIEWLLANPGHLETASRDLVEQIGVSHVTIYKAQQIIKSDHGYTNGHAQ